MRSVGLFCIVLLLGACSEGKNTEEKVSRVDLLVDDMWMLNATENSQDLISYGVKFSKDKKVFYIDSQGRITPTFDDIGFKIEQDTLRIIDFKYEQKYLFEKGTRIFLIKTLDEDELVLKMIHPEVNEYYFKNKIL